MRRIRSHRPFSYPALVLACAGLASCLPVQEDPRRELLASWADHVILPQYDDFAEQADALDAAVLELCEAPSVEGIEAARSAWHDARAPLKRMELLKFGPSTDEPWRVTPRVDFWPARVDTIEETLTGTSTLDPELMGSAQVGMPVIEYLLYAPEMGKATLAAALVDEPRRCVYLTTLSADLADQAHLMSTAWDPDGDDYYSEFVEAGDGSVAFPEINDAVGEVVNRLHFTVENIRNDKLAAPLAADADAPQPDVAESRFAPRSLRDIKDNLRGVELFYFGAKSPDAIGVDDFIPELGDGMRERLQASYDAIDAIPPPLIEAVTTDPASIEAADVALAELQRYVQVDVLDALGLSASFNDADGD